MEYKDYAIRFFLGVLEIEFNRGRDVSAPNGGPEWLERLINYLFSEYANSHDELYKLGVAFSEARDFDDLKRKLSVHGLSTGDIRT